MQRIYTGCKINFGVACINVRGVRSKKLKINYRTTEPIKRVAVSIVKGIDNDDMDKCLSHPDINLNVIGASSTAATSQLISSTSRTANNCHFAIKSILLHYYELSWQLYCRDKTLLLYEPQEYPINQKYR